MGREIRQLQDANDVGGALFDWSSQPSVPDVVTLNDETLRDGLQAPGAQNPTIEKKRVLIHQMNDIGIEHASLGMPASGLAAAQDIAVVASEVASARLALKPNCA